MRGWHLLVLVMAGFLACSGLALAQNACDLNHDNTVNVVDGQLAVNMSLGLTPCTAAIAGQGVCTSTVVQRVMNAALGMSCVVDGLPHSVILTWNASLSANTAGYNVYRALTTAGPFSKINSALVTTTTYTDTAIQAGQTYYYVATTINNSNVESAYSTPATKAVVPTP